MPTRLQRFQQCLHRQFLIPVLSVCLLDAKLTGFSYVVRPFTGSRRPTVLSGYFFSTHTFLCINKSKIYSSVLFVELSSDARLSLPGRPTLQGMWTYLCAFRENLPKGTKKSVTEVRLKLTTLWLGPRCSILLSYSAKLGRKYLKNTPYLPL